MSSNLGEVLFSALSDSKHIGICLADESGKPVFSNAAFLQCLSLEKAPDSLFDVVPAEARRALPREKGIQGFWQAKENFGGLQNFEFLLTQVFIGPESAPHILAMLMPSDEGANLRAIGQATSKYGHDLNNLLGAMRGASDLLAHKLSKIHSDENPVARQISLINSSIAKSVRITTRMRSYPRVDELPRMKLSISDLLQGLLEVIDESDIACELLLDFRNTGPVYGSDFHLSQAFQNIVLNAIEAMKSLNDRVLTILVDSVKIDNDSELSKGDYLLVAIIDHGKGMDEQRLKKAFEPFYSTSARQIGSGMGLGLPMARQIIKDHDGELRLVSIPDCGTVVQVYLPLMK